MAAHEHADIAHAVAVPIADDRNRAGQAETIVLHGHAVRIGDDPLAALVQVARRSRSRDRKYRSWDRRRIRSHCSIGAAGRR